MTDDLSTKEPPLKKRLHAILQSQCLDSQRLLITALAADLQVDLLDCAAALLHLNQTTNNTPAVSEAKTSLPPMLLKMVRYRLDVGLTHHVTVEELKKVLVEESGVDKNNIHNISIRNLYTLIELPDAMPADIFLHLKSVEINRQKLNIKRVKTRSKSRKNGHLRRPKHTQRPPISSLA
jgi:hypothetical protein